MSVRLFWSAKGILKDVIKEYAKHSVSEIPTDKVCEGVYIMAISYDYFEGSKNPKNIVDCIANNLEFNKQHPNYFKPEGITIFSGSQGEGKTLSAVEFCKNILIDYPRAIFCTNTAIKGIYNKTYEFTGLECLENINNGEYGVVYLIDEIQNYLNSLLSRNVPLSTIVNLTQQRKQRKLIVGTSQVYGRMAKPLREQVKNVILCRKVLGFVQVNKLIDSMLTHENSNGELVTVPKKVFVWFHSPLMYKCYDTYQKQYGLAKPPENNVIVVNSENLNN